MIEINGKEFEITKFPNGESLLDFKDFSIDSREGVRVTLYFGNNEDLINLMFIKKHLDSHFRYKKKLLILKYMPYSRMDRPINDFAFTLKYVCEFINGLKFDSVYVSEPHSYTSIALLDNCTYGLTSVDVAKKAMDVIGFSKNKDYIMFVDAGAQKKYSEYFKDYNIVIGHKKRNLQTGAIEELNLVGCSSLKESKILIVDDLCSRGGSFLWASESIVELGTDDIYLAITHLEKNVLTGTLPSSELVKKIFIPSDSVYTGKAFKKLNFVDIGGFNG